MKTIKLSAFAACGMIGSLALAACDIDVPDLNNPGLAPLQNAPTASLVNSAATGLLILNRTDIATEIGYIGQLGIVGRESYNFDSADARFLDEVAIGTLNKASPFGGAFWTAEYANILQENIILAGIDKVADFSTDPAEVTADKAGITGFTETIQALDYLKVILTHEADGAVVDPPTNPDVPLAPFVSQAMVYAKITKLLDDGAAQLATAVAGGDKFTFLLSNGFAGFDMPSTFLTFNRALRARVAVYLKDYTTAATALSTSFINDDTTMGPIDMTVGVYYTFSTAAGDTTSALTNKNIFVFPPLANDVQMKGTTPDARYTAKVSTTTMSGSESGRSSSLVFTQLRASPSTPIGLIRNEELILLKAEVLAQTDLAAATTELNLVRVQSGGLDPIAPPASIAAFTTALLYEREFSLLMEAHRWVDLRRFGVPLPLDMPTDVANERYPIPQPECDARPGEAACNVSTTGFLPFN